MNLDVKFNGSNQSFGTSFGKANQAFDTTMDAAGQTYQGKYSPTDQTFDGKYSVGGVELPELNNPGTAEDLMDGKELIDGEGKVVTGSFSIDSELSAQDTLIEQIKVALHNKTAVQGVEDYQGEYDVTPSSDAQTLATKDKRMRDDVTVKAIPFFEVSNNAGGNTVYIGTPED